MNRTAMLLVACCLFPFAAASLRADPPKIARIVLQGLESVEEPFVRLTIQSRRDMPFDEKILEADLEALRATGLFSSVSHRVEPLREGQIRLTLLLSEAPVVKKITVTGAALVAGETIRAMALPLEGKTPNPKALEDLRQSIADAYRAAGWFACGVDGEKGIRLGEGGTLEIRIVEPVLATIRLEGLKRVRPIDVRRRLVLPPGKVLSLEAMKRSVRRLGKLGTLRSAVFAVDEGDPPPGKVNLVLRIVEESHTGELAYGMRYTTVDKSFGTVELTKRNIFSTGKTLTLESEFGGRKTYQAKIATDWFLGSPIGGEASLFRQKYSRQVREGDAITSTFDERRQGLGFAVSKTLRHGQLLRLGLKNEKVSATATDDYLLPSNLAAIGGNPYSADYTQQTLRLSATRGPYLLPLSDEAPRASYLDLDYVGGPLEGPADYLRLRGGKRILRPRGHRNRLAMRVELGSIYLRSGILPFLESLTLGGSETLRGYEYKEFTGNRLILANLEYRRFLSPRFDAVAFMDWGDCWSDDLRSFDGKVGYGLGLRIDLSLFRLRIDAAHGVGRDGTQFTFGVGHLF